jgi:hypothetical protein
MLPRQMVRQFVTASKEIAVQEHAWEECPVCGAEVEAWSHGNFLCKRRFADPPCCYRATYVVITSHWTYLSDDEMGLRGETTRNEYWEGTPPLHHASQANAALVLWRVAEPGLFPHWGEFVPKEVAIEANFSGSCQDLVAYLVAQGFQLDKFLKYMGVEHYAPSL